ncbi:MAG: hypothetical protein NZ853_11395 [Leptospiraceae bacterium]|nr:hypothetical protein [Leptospiraceae bacterium]MDW7977142.1 hypothetical protein [Leptospiraceae bacterium]
MKKFFFHLFSLGFFALILLPLFSEEKIRIEVKEIKEEVPFYRTFQILASNPFSEPRTVLGKIVFDTGEVCLFYFELMEKQNQQQVRHCKVQTRRATFQVVIEKIYPFVISDSE